ncbi:chemotaxis protein CheB [Aliikangiella coralliicola]|uniref:protein-glutamate methylesterase n=1 Tax=Aliikangiella coralliicola TaxID=2592383 RepID=A0A545U4I7_9GAMM|nr:chemotaxis protein CheB [Aliikangiella coralliicola]TQV84372.1 chemotaxis protein CheB [Aliikangiella coralliicola]
MNQPIGRVVLIGGSAGSIKTVHQIITSLPADYCFPVIIAIHCAFDSDPNITRNLRDKSPLNVIEVTDKLKITLGSIFVAPCGYHLLIENVTNFSLSLDEKVNFCRPSIDVLFSSAAEVFGARCVGILLSGANKDGADGLLDIVQAGGFGVVQSPESSLVSAMPQAAIDLGIDKRILDPEEIVLFLNSLSKKVDSDQANN